MALRSNVCCRALAALGLGLLAGCAATAPVAPGQAGAIDRAPEDEIIYFVMPDRFENGNRANDRGGIEGGRLDHGFDPSDNGFYHGGDLQGLASRLDYIEGLGATAIWLTPIFENKPVQGPPGRESAAYHGYWITDFTNVDPHLGTREDFRALVDAAHERGMKVYMDIITNHTADIIKYAECHGPDAPARLRAKGECPYRSKGDYPWTRRGGPDGPAINAGFLGDDPRHRTAANFARLESTDYAYTVTIPADERDIKHPAWLNDPGHYHNRGNSHWHGESALSGDFAGLDDLMTESPVVVEGMIDIYSQWITDFRVDGFRIDTAKHVNPEFWQEFIPAIQAHARKEGIPHFHIFGEVYEFDPGQLAKFTHVDGLPSVLDFAFQGAVRDIVVDGGSATRLARLFEIDRVYAPGAMDGRRLPTFLGNHDMGRFAGFLRQERPGISDREMLARLELAHAIMMFSRGVPTIYYGDEQGFVSDGGDRGARENMFRSRVPDYNDNDLVGTDATTAQRNFDTAHRLYRAIAELAAIRSTHPALRHGRQVVRHADEDAGLFVMSRFAPEGGAEYVIAFNADPVSREISIAVDGRASGWESLHGDCLPGPQAPGHLSLRVPALSALVCRGAMEVQRDG
jgi:neopullulanase